MMPPRAVTRWVTPEGLVIDLTQLTQTSRNAGRKGLTYGGAWDGWVLTTRHPASRVVISTTYLGRDVPEDELAAALEAVRAVPVIRPKRPARHKPL
jgi:hypothetical protein